MVDEIKRLPRRRLSIAVELLIPSIRALAREKRNLKNLVQKMVSRQFRYISLTLTLKIESV
ncbi:hypothetical protein BpHYR1_003419 [Brachionus plicatilis]|uniref:Uncharacterized protein n=1 Tax=Brachionus plicatilis TaxID=10195 RepID=A0A3M7RCJ1_BRAPC|nr:hypothetical protein BpHYR1_003419 [Brachionus plicatilis]